MKRIVFFGTPAFAAEVFTGLYTSEQHKKDFEIVALVSAPDRRRDRGLQLQPCATKKRVMELCPSLPVLQPLKASAPDVCSSLAAFSADVFIFVAYGQIVKASLLSLPRLGCINLHTSLLPKYRGAAPMQASLLAAEQETGVSVISMVEKMDAGDILCQKRMPLPLDFCLGDLEKALIPLAVEALEELCVHKLFKGKEQEHTQASYAPKISSKDLLLDSSLAPAQLHNRIRAFSPRPAAYFLISHRAKQKRLKIFKSECIDCLGDSSLSPHFVSSDSSLFLQNAHGRLKILSLQIEGKKRVSARDFLCGISPQDLILESSE